MERITKIYQHPVYQKELQFVLETEQDRQFCRHDMQHFLDVARIGWILCMERKLDIAKELIYAAAFLHDIGRGMQYREGISHDEASGLLAEQILSECGFSVAETKMVCEAIAGHRMSSKATVSRSQLGEILEEADHVSRSCFACEAEPECYWPKDKKNLKIRM